MKGYFEKMKKFVLAFGIPVLAVASLIGSGYATWYFNSGIVADNKVITVEPTPKQVVGAMFQQHGDGIKLVLDQTDKTATDGMPAGRKGVHFVGAFQESLIADVDGNPETPDTFVSGTSYKITTTIKIPSEVAEYVDFTFDGKTSSVDGKTLSVDGKNYVTLTKESTFAAEDDHENFFKISYDLHNTDVTVAYAKDQDGKSKEPSTSAEYDTMKSAVSNKTISIDFEAVIVVA